ncbi:hypothetical protein [Candidatus Nitrosocosmicus hydrocola]|uniref:hypothetical protein n=1 Tax=Candidatus Nitrosocosmicus hydrocola TaxID=1826872 RepID=UPI0011E5BFA9|nr:hypothetical protein [Candidatus Nitrosocosmicus hydrocola]
MMDNQTLPSNKENSATDPFKRCVGIECKNHAAHYMKILLVNKSYWLCDKCKKDLESMNLIYSESSE